MKSLELQKISSRISNEIDELHHKVFIIPIIHILDSKKFSYFNKFRKVSVESSRVLLKIFNAKSALKILIFLVSLLAPFLVYTEELKTPSQKTISEKYSCPKKLQDWMTSDVSAKKSIKMFDPFDQTNDSLGRKFSLADKKNKTCFDSIKLEREALLTLNTAKTIDNKPKKNLTNDEFLNQLQQSLDNELGPSFQQQLKACSQTSNEFDLVERSKAVRYYHTALKTQDALIEHLEQIAFIDSILPKHNLEKPHCKPELKKLHNECKKLTDLNTSCKKEYTQEDSTTTTKSLDHYTEYTKNILNTLSKYQNDYQKCVQNTLLTTDKTSSKHSPQNPESRIQTECQKESEAINTIYSIAPWTKGSEFLNMVQVFDSKNSSMKFTTDEFKIKKAIIKQLEYDRHKALSSYKDKENTLKCFDDIEPSKIENYETKCDINNLILESAAQTYKAESKFINFNNPTNLSDLFDGDQCLIQRRAVDANFIQSAKAVKEITTGLAKDVALGAGAQVLTGGVVPVFLLRAASAEKYLKFAPALIGLSKLTPYFPATYAVYQMKQEMPKEILEACYKDEPKDQAELSFKKIQDEIRLQALVCPTENQAALENYKSAQKDKTECVKTLALKSAEVAGAIGGFKAVQHSIESSLVRSEEQKTRKQIEEHLAQNAEKLKAGIPGAIERRHPEKVAPKVSRFSKTKRTADRENYNEVHLKSIPYDPKIRDSKILNTPDTKYETELKTSIAYRQEHLKAKKQYSIKKEETEILKTEEDILKTEKSLLSSIEVQNKNSTQDRAEMISLEMELLELKKEKLKLQKESANKSIPARQSRVIRKTNKTKIDDLDEKIHDLSEESSIYFEKEYELSKIDPKTQAQAYAEVQKKYQQKLEEHYRTLANKEYIKKANEDDLKSKEELVSQGIYHSSTENAFTKKLNDATGDKDRVTSANNDYSNRIMDGILVLKKQMQREGLTTPEISSFYDYKGMKFRFENASPEWIKRYETLENVTKKKYADDLLKANIFRKDDHPQNWFRSGLGRTADDANAAARSSRHLTNNEVVHFDNSETQLRLQSIIKQVEGLHKDLIDNLPSKLMQTDSKTGLKLLKPDVIDGIRKTKTDEELQKYILNNLGQKIDKATANDLRLYISKIDEFSPAILNPKRVIASFSSQEGGGITSDFAGMGAQNIYGTQKAILDSIASSDTPEKTLFKAIKNARREEQLVTKLFQKKQKSFINSVTNFLGDKKAIEHHIACSGDDCIVVVTSALDEKTKREMIQRFSKSEKPSSIRLSFIRNDVINQSERNEIGADAEGIEKILRSKAVGPGKGKIPKEKLDQLTFAIDMQTQKVNSGEVRLVIGNAKTQLTKTERNYLEDILEEAIEVYNAKKSKENNKAVEYILHSNPSY